MTEHIFYNIQTQTSFKYEKDENQNHLLYIVGTFTSPITNQIHTVQPLIQSGSPDAEYQFYRGTESVMTNTYSMKGFLATAMAEILKEEYAQAGGGSIDEIAKQKFFERLEQQLTLDIYIDLTKEYQHGTP